jgi:hypothetical protein
LSCLHHESSSAGFATEEAFAIPELMDGMRKLAASGADDPDFDFWRGLNAFRS